MVIPQQTTAEVYKSQITYTNTNEPEGFLMVEEVIVKPAIVAKREDAQYFSWRMKVRNISDQDLLATEDSMHVWYRYLDDNMDIVYTSSEQGGYQTDLPSGKAEWLEIPDYRFPVQWGKEEMESIAYIEIYGYNFKVNYGTPKYEIAEPILIDLRELEYNMQ